MSKKMAIWCAVGVFCLSSSAALAIVQDSQKGSLLIYPRIDVTEGKTTLVQITNDANRFINLQCYWMDAGKTVLDFELQLSRNQTVVFDAATGIASVGAKSVPRFPQTGSRVGELACWAVEAGLVDQGGDGLVGQVSWNHLLGVATVIDFVSQDAFEYSAFAFRALNVGIDRVFGTPGRLDLNDGRNAAGAAVAGYDACPRILVGQFSPVGAILTAGTSTVGYVANRLTVASCTQDLRQDRNFIYTKLNWVVYNDNEVGFTGAWECSDSWYQTWLGDKVSEKYASPPPSFGPSDPAGWQSFVAQYLHSNVGAYRLWSTASTACGPQYQPQQIVGLMAVQASWLKLGVPNNWKPVTYQADGTPSMHPVDRIRNFSDDAVGYGLTSQPATVNGQILFDPAMFGSKQ